MNQSLFLVFSQKKGPERTLPEVMRHIERLRIKNIIPGVVKRCHDWLDKDSRGNHVFTDLETNGEETLLFACAAFRGLIVDFGLLVDMNCLINEEDFHGLCGLSERYAQAIAELTPEASATAAKSG